MHANDSLIIFAEKASPRLSYIIGVLFQDKAVIAHTIPDFVNGTGIKINYSPRVIDAADCHIHPHGLLDQETIEQQQLDIIYWNKLPAFFATQGSIPFDLFSAAFYLISRYEEWLPHQKDALGRYNPVQSMAYQNGFLGIPLVNYWLAELALLLGTSFKRSYSFIPSYDIDIAYSYRNHSLLRNTLGYFKQLVSGQLNGLVERMQVLAGMQKDPYDVFDWLNTLHEKLPIKPIYFFLLAAKRDKLHKNIMPTSAAMKALIQTHAQQYTVGIHPSIAQKNKSTTLLKEKQLLEKIITKPVKQSRQHYIALQFPATYEALIDAHIEEDYSMGYPQINGFRASYTGPFKWFNLSKNQATELTIYPFCYMDSTAIFQEKKTASEAAVLLNKLLNIHQQYGGTFIPIFHNNFLTTQPENTAWRNAHAAFLLTLSASLNSD